MFERGSGSGTDVSTQYRTSPIPAGALEIPLPLRFACPDQDIIRKMNGFECRRTEDDEDDGEEQEEIEINTEEVDAIDIEEEDSGDGEINTK